MYVCSPNLSANEFDNMSAQGRGEDLGQRFDEDYQKWGKVKNRRSNVMNGRLDRTENERKAFKLVHRGSEPSILSVSKRKDGILSQLSAYRPLR
jgi:hypothetical protein